MRPERALAQMAHRLLYLWCPPPRSFPAMAKQPGQASLSTEETVRAPQEGRRNEWLREQLELRLH
jgi:hypothetical protein